MDDGMVVEARNEWKLEAVMVSDAEWFGGALLSADRRGGTGGVALHTV